MNYCIQCLDRASGKTGNFVYDPVLQSDRAGAFYAITPAFSDLQEFYAWCSANGVALEH